MKSKKLLLLNLGTTSFKFRLYGGPEGETVVAEGMVDRVGGSGSYSITLPQGKVEAPCACKSCTDAFELCAAVLRENGVLGSLEELDAVGYKAVHGGPLSGTRMVDDALLRAMERFVPFAPAHNPVYLELMKSLRQRYPALRQAARFETSFHATVPAYRTAYGVPYQWQEDLGIRRYCGADADAGAGRQTGDLGPLGRVFLPLRHPGRGKRGYQHGGYAADRVVPEQPRGGF